MLPRSSGRLRNLRSTAPCRSSAIDELSTREQIRDAIASYCQFLDDGRFEEFAGLWTEDAAVHVRGDVHEGRDAIRAWMEAVQPPEARGRHVVANTRFTDVGQHLVNCVSDFVFFARTSEGGWRPSASGRYVDQWTDREGPWRLEERRIEM